MHAHSLIVNLVKICQFVLPFFLVHRISAQGAVPLPARVQVVAEFPNLVVVKSLQEFFGMVNFYNRLIPSTAHLLQLLYEALLSRKTTGKVVWTEDWIAALDGVKSALANALLAHPDSDAQIALTTDASYVAVGAVVEKCVGDAWQPLAFFSYK